MSIKSVKTFKYLLGFIVIIILLSLLIQSTKIKSEENTLLKIFSVDGINKEVRNNKELIEESLKIQHTFRSIADTVIPAVVSINSEKISSFYKEKEIFDPNLFKKYFLGSGIIVSEDGYIITNNHLISNSKKIYVTISNYRKQLHTTNTIDNILSSTQKEYPAKIIGVQQDLDIAILKINSDKTLPVTYLGNSNEVKVGDFAIAIGNPFGLTGTFTLGIISAIDRRIPSDIYSPNLYFFQTDACIHSGNSGGPLVNIDGQVIGINTAIFTVGENENFGISFVIPINYIKKYAESTIKGEKYEVPYLGLILGEDVITNQPYILRADNGVFIAGTFKNSQANKKGILKGDILVSINKKRINNRADYYKNLLDYNIGDVIFFTILRNSEIIKTELKIEPKPAIESSDYYSTNFLGILVDSVTKEHQGIIIPKNLNGVLVIGIEKGSAANTNNILVGDIITRINNIDIQSLKAYNEIVKKLPIKNTSHLIELKRLVKGNIITKKIYVSLK